MNNLKKINSDVEAILQEFFKKSVTPAVEYFNKEIRELIDHRFDKKMNDLDDELSELDSKIEKLEDVKNELKGAAENLEQKFTEGLETINANFIEEINRTSERVKSFIKTANNNQLEEFAKIKSEITESINTSRDSIKKELDKTFQDFESKMKDMLKEEFQSQVSNVIFNKIYKLTKHYKIWLYIVIAMIIINFALVIKLLLM